MERGVEPHLLAVRLELAREGLEERRRAATVLKERGHAARGRGETLGDEVLLVRERAAEVHVRIDESGEDESAMRVDARLGIGQRVGGPDGGELPVADRRAALDDTRRRDDPRVRDDEIGSTHGRTLAT